MNLSYYPTMPVIDKLVLKASEFRVLPGSNMCIATTTNPATGQRSEKKYMNIPGIGTIEVRNDKQGYPSCYITTNPNKAGMQAGNIMCREAGVMLNINDTNVLRLDIARDMPLVCGTQAYHPIMQAAMATRMQYSISNGTTCRVHNKLHEICLYNKSIESNLPTPGIHRLEVRYRTSKYPRKHGITTLADVIQHDAYSLLDMYQKSGKLMLPKLHVLNDDVERIGNGVAMLQHYQKTEKHWFSMFLSVHGFLAYGPDELMNIINASSLTKDQRCKARKQVKKYADMAMLNIGVTSLREEIIRYFAA